MQPLCRTSGRAGPEYLLILPSRELQSWWQGKPSSAATETIDPSEVQYIMVTKEFSQKPKNNKRIKHTNFRRPAHWFTFLLTKYIDLFIPSNFCVRNSQTAAILLSTKPNIETCMATSSLLHAYLLPIWTQVVNAMAPVRR
jgi:hypothetical protein